VIDLELDQVDLLLQEVQLIKETENLNNHVQMFQEAYKEKPLLLFEIFKHIKKNFLSQIKQYKAISSKV